MRLICYQTGKDPNFCDCPGCVTWRTVRYTPLRYKGDSITVGQSPNLPSIAKRAGNNMNGSELPMSDIEVGRHALRTFRIRNVQVDGKPKKTLTSTYKDYNWDPSGTIVAQCLNEHSMCTTIPGTNCHCGIYGSLSLDILDGQYKEHARRCVAVIAAEGDTIIGEKGLRTSAARIVAYWVHDEDDCKAFAGCKGAKYYKNMAKMLKAFDFPVWEGKNVGPGEKVERGQYPPKAKLPPQVDWPGATGVSQKEYDRAVKMLDKLMGQTATPKGLDAIKHALSHLL